MKESKSWVISKGIACFKTSLVLILIQTSSYGEVILNADFTSENWIDRFVSLAPVHWSEGKDRTRRVFDQQRERFILEVAYPKGKFGNDKTGAQWTANLGKSFQSLTLTYFVKFDPGFDFVKGGKLPGLTGGHRKGHPHAKLTGGHQPDGTDGWSARVMWRKDGRIVQYVYHMHQPDKHGEDFSWVIDSKPATFQPGKWQELKTQIVMNDLTKKNGCVRSWLDGVKALDQCTFEFRTIPDIGIDALYFSTFFGGNDSTWSTKKDERIRFDSFKVEDSKIVDCKSKFGNVACTREYLPSECMIEAVNPFEALKQKGSNRCEAMIQLEIQACLRGQTIDKSKVKCVPAL